MLKIENLCKKYPSFELKNVSFELPKGYVMGFIGQNGAGKTTTLKALLNIVQPDSGTVTILGENISGHEVELKQRIGFMLGEANYYPRTKVKTIAEVFKRFYTNWDEAAYQSYLKRFNINENKRIIELSTGMRVKLALTFALSHNAELMIFDEPTSGLDPIARDELLDVFHEIVESGERSILFSTQITSDLDKIADYIVFIQNGQIIANATKEDLISGHFVVSGKKDELTKEVKARLISYKANAFGFTGLIKKENIKATDTFMTSLPNLEDIMVYYSRGEKI